MPDLKTIKVKCKKFVSLFILIISFSISLSGYITGETEWTDDYALIVLSSQSFEEASRAREFIMKNGGAIAIVSSPNIMTGWIPREKAKQLENQHGIELITFDPINPSALYYQAQSSSLVHFFNSVVSHEHKSVSETMEESGPPCINDALPNPMDTGSRKQAHVSTAGTSDLMTGKIAVGLFYIESDGSIDPDLYSWTSDDLNKIQTQIYRGLSWWALKARDYGQSLTFYLYRMKDSGEWTISQGYEPIIHKASEDHLWINAIMNKLGYSSSKKFQNVQDFNKWLQATYKTDGSYSVFIAANPPSQGAPNRFGDGRFAYAYLGGPYTQLCFKNAEWSVNDFGKILRHESGHIFWACDEYYLEGYGGCQNCKPCNAFNAVVNGNCNNDLCNSESVPCIMRQNENALCDYTAAQIGWIQLELGCNDVIALTNGQLYSGTTVGGTNRVSQYDCSSVEESGPEALHSIIVYETGDLTVTLSDMDANLDLFILTDCSDKNSCIAYGDSSVMIQDIAPGTYFIVVDGYKGESSAYTITAACPRKTIEVTNPHSNTCWTAKTACRIEWKTFEPGSYVNISLYKGEMKIDDIAQGTANDGFLKWYPPSNLPSGNDYTIKIEKASTSDYSDTFGIHCKPEQPAWTEYGDADCNGVVTLCWRGSCEAFTYELQRDTWSSFPSPVTVYQGTKTCVKEEGLEAGVYYYRVRSWNNCSVHSGWKKGQPLSAGISLPVLTEIVFPPSDCDGTLSISWNTDSITANFRVERATDPQFSDAVAVYIGSQTGYNETELAPGTYYFRVKAENGCGESDWLETDAIRVFNNALEAPIGESPPQGKKNVPVLTELIWSHVDTTSYRVYFGTRSPPPFVKEVTENHYDPGALLPGITYYWKVAAINECGDIPSVEMHFTTKAIESDNSPSCYKLLVDAIWAHAKGGGIWNTEVQIMDVTGGSQVSVYFNSSGRKRRGPFVLWTGNKAGQSIKFTNFLNTLENLDNSTFSYFGKTGAIEFTTQSPEHKIHVTARIKNGNCSKRSHAFNNTESNFADISHSLIIQNLSNNAEYSSSMACFNPTTNPVTAEFQILSAKNQPIGRTFSKTFNEKEYKDFLPFEEAGRAYPAFSFDNVVVKIKVTSGLGNLICIGATSNKISHDSASHIPVQVSIGFVNSPSDYVILPEAIWAPAQGGGMWMTEAQITDITGGSKVSVFFNYKKGRRRGPFTLWISPGQNTSIKISNLLKKIEELDPNSFKYFKKIGAIEFTTQDSSHRIHIAARTRNGHFSKIVPTLNDIDSHFADTSREVIVDLVSNASYRASAALFNPTNRSVVVKFKLTDRNNGPIGKTFTKKIKGREFLAINPFEKAGRPTPQYNYDAAFLSIKPLSGSGKVICLGATSNNISHDSTSHLPLGTS